MLDIKTIQSIRIARIEIKHPISGDPLGAFVSLISHDHPDRKIAIRDYNRVLRKIGEGDAEDQVTQRTEAHRHYVVSCMSNWEGIADDGTALAFSTAVASALLAKPELDWLLNQISIALIDQKNFIAAQPKV